MSDGDEAMKTLRVELEALRLAATRVVQLATHAAIAELRRVLDANPEVAE